MWGRCGGIAKEKKKPMKRKLKNWETQVLAAHLITYV